MIIGVRTFDLHIPGCRSLKEKRFVIKSLRDKIRAKFNVSVAEVEHQDLWQRSIIAVVGVSENRAYINTQLDLVLEVIESEHRATLLSFETEFL